MNVKKGELIQVWKKVFSNKKYLIITFILAILFYSVGVFFANLRLLLTILESDGFFNMISSFPLFLINYKDFFTIPYFIGLIILSLLFGMFFSLIFYKTKMLKDAGGKKGIIASTGIFLGIIAPGCSACGIGALSFLGIGGSILGILPFFGFVLIIISASIMAFLIYRISIDINKGLICEPEEQ